MVYFYRRVAVFLGLLHSHVTKKLDCLKAGTVLLRFSFVIVKKSKTFTHVDDVFDLSRIRYLTLQCFETSLIWHVSTVIFNIKIQNTILEFKSMRATHASSALQINQSITMRNINVIHTLNLSNVFAKTLFESFDFDVQIHKTWMLMQTQYIRTVNLTSLT